MTGCAKVLDGKDSVMVVKAASGSNWQGLGRSGRPPADECAMLGDNLSAIAWEQ